MTHAPTGLPARLRHWIAAAGFALAGCAAPPSAARAPEFGVHLGAGCAGRAAIPAFERFAGRKVERVVDAFNQSDWTQFRSSIGWLSGCWKGAPVKLTVSVPMLTQSGGGTLRDGAAGAYDPILRQVAETLVANGQSDAIVRLGWEFNGNWQPWHADGDPAGFVAYYRRAVGVMRAVPGQHFRFEWTTALGKQAIAPDLAYPGDDVVDLIGSDVYNEYWSAALAEPHVRFAWLMNQPYGLKWLRDFAAAHGKLAAYSEWGSGTRKDGHGAGDDPYFIASMADWFHETGPLYQSYWEVADAGYDDTVSLGRHPEAASAYKAAFGRASP